MEFGNDFARNVHFSVNNSSSSHADNQINAFLGLGEEHTFGINATFGEQEKKNSINFSKAETKFCLTLYYNGDNSYLFADGKEIYKVKPITKMLTLDRIIVNWKIIHIFI